MAIVERPGDLVGFTVLRAGVRVGTVDARTRDAAESDLLVDRSPTMFGHELPLIHRRRALPLDAVVEVDHETETVVVDPAVAEPLHTFPRWMGTRGADVPGGTQTSVPTKGDEIEFPLDPSRPPGPPQP